MAESHTRRTDAAIRACPPRGRVAVAAACSEHMRRLYRNDPEVGELDGFADRTFAIAWRFVDGGRVDLAEVNRLRLETEAFERRIDEDDAPGEFVYAAQTLAYTLRAILEPDVVKWASYAVTTADSAVYAARGLDPKDSEDEEIAWQCKALDLVRAAGDQPVPRAQWQVLVAEKPRWLARLETLRPWIAEP
ncbi:MAG: hypothetical protein AAF721_03875 [Myxococcota bacterium]